ncbi:YhjD/YihY/BrkB family envelope integrity protein [Streptomyces sp. NBC_01431]|uniref:YhjD/YihY/BrkB family envelope integrity protein n=1 Tax=Streptomyces sp. NBC_01431 TaxID=2903863 RepID=UPI002E3126BB|nr:YhjD/YihY/BrkB family envelope integrity protein [Streptomyces sp. NBC_01431]
MDTATRLAAQAFLAALPALFVIAAFAPAASQEQLRSSLRAVVGLEGASAEQVSRIYQVNGETRGDTWGTIGILVTILSATSCSRVLQRLCERAWHLPHLRTHLVIWLWVAWLLVWLAALLFQGTVRDGFGVGPALGVPLTVIASTLLWWWTQHLLPGSRVPWLPLLPAAVLTGGGAVAVSAASTVFLPDMLNRGPAQFGPLGPVFTLLSWLIALFTVITAGIAIGYVLAHEKRLARYLLTREGGASRPRAVPATGSEPAGRTDGPRR